MKRRGFLQSLLAATGAAAIPSRVPAASLPDAPTSAAPQVDPPPAVPRRRGVTCVLYDYDGHLVMEGAFEGATARIVVPVKLSPFWRRSNDVGDDIPSRRFGDAVFERRREIFYEQSNGYRGLRRIEYVQVDGPRLPRRNYVV